MQIYPLYEEKYRHSFMDDGKCVGQGTFLGFKDI